MRLVSNICNFARGQIDHDMSGRFDLPIQQTASDKFSNFTTNFKGNAIFRRGCEVILPFQDCAFYEFRFSNSQNYLMVFYLNKIRFLSYASNGAFGWVESSPGVPLEVTTPYTLLQSKSLQVTQNADVMIVTYPGLPPYKLKRTAANAFTMRPSSRKDDPFLLTSAATKTVTAVTQAANAQVTVAAHGYTVNQQVTFASVVGMTQLNGYTATIVNIVDANNFTIDVDTTKFTAYSSGGTTALALTGDYPRCCLFYKGRLYYANTPLHTTTVWASQAANYDAFTLPSTPTDTDALKFTPADISQEIAWLFGGDNSLIIGSADGIVAANGGDIGKAITSETVAANLTSAPGCNGTIPIRKDGLVFYVGFDGRNMYSFNYDLLNARFKADDANLLAYDITKGGMNKLRWKKDRDDLIYSLRGDGAYLTNNFNKDENINGWHVQTTYTGDTFNDLALITDNIGKPQIFFLALRNGTYYIEHKAEIIEFVKRVDFFTGEENEDADQEAYYRLLAEQLKDCNYLDNSLEYSDLRDNIITYNPGTGRITATSAAFSAGDVGKEIAYQTQTGYESGRFEITGYISTTVVTVDVLQTPTNNTFRYWYKSFSSITGMTPYIGRRIAVVADGGLLDYFTIAADTLNLGTQVTQVRVGYNYRGLIKSFSMGFVVQGQNTQGTLKAVARAGIRTVTSAGLKFGTSQYDLEDVQQLQQGDLNYLPPLPMDGTKFIDWVDEADFDKFWYIVQDDPLPAFITCLMVDANHEIRP